MNQNISLDDTQRQILQNQQQDISHNYQQQLQTEQSLNQENLLQQQQQTQRQRNSNSIQMSDLNQSNIEVNSEQLYPFEDEYEYKESDYTCYMNCLSCCGSLQGCLRTWLPCFCCCLKYPYIKVRQFEKGILQRFGQFREFLEPGLHKINPLTESIQKVNKRTQIVNVGQQSILTKDNLTVLIDAVVYYRIVEPKKVLYRIKDIYQSVVEITTASLRTICGENTLQTILEQRQRVSEEISEYLYDHIKNWGILIEQVFIKDMAIDQNLQITMSAAAKMRRVGESKVISAKADVESAGLYREAADTLDSKAAIQIRYLETIQNLAKHPNPKIAFIQLEDQEFQEVDVEQQAENFYNQNLPVQGGEIVQQQQQKQQLIQQQPQQLIQEQTVQPLPQMQQQQQQNIELQNYQQQQFK